MGIFDYFFAKKDKAIPQQYRAMASGGDATFHDLNDPELLEFIRTGVVGAGAYKVLNNMAILRCVLLISNSIGMLPFNLFEVGDKRILAKDHAAYRLVKRKPNDWLTPIEFKALMQIRALIFGNAYARVIWSSGRPIALIPLDSGAVTPELVDGWKIRYTYHPKQGGAVQLMAHEVFHLRDLILDGLKGASRIRLASGAVELAALAEDSAKRIFKTGVMAGGALETDRALSEPAYNRLKTSITENYSGSDNAGKWMVLEEGLKAQRFSSTAHDAQQVENRNHQIEEISRLFGVPRPLMMMDDTSWGSGIEQLAIFFIQYTLAPWFVAWEQAAARVLLSEAEFENYYFKFNERALLRGTLKDQSEFFAKALGAGGQSPWMTKNEVRDLADLPKSDQADADMLHNPMTQTSDNNELNKTS